MTFSILTFDKKTGVFAAAAATGSLCVGGWVLRGDIESGIVASQGTAPSTFWRDDVLRAIYLGHPAEAAINKVIADDAGCEHRQITALDKQGNTHGYTGQSSTSFAQHTTKPGLAIAGNMLVGPQVLDAMMATYLKDKAPAAQKMLNALNAAKDAGGDSRGLQSAAMLIMAPEQPPLDLRIDYDEDPIAALEQLYLKTRQSPYNNWLAEVPVYEDKSRSPS